jgi:hypothetical protein
MSRCMRVLALFSILVVLLSACNLPLRPVSSTPPIALTIAAGSGTAIATLESPPPSTQTPQIVTETPVPTDTGEPPARPTNTKKPAPQPSATSKPPVSPPVAGAALIAFSPGATSGDVTGHLASGGQNTYYFGAGAGQLLLAAAYSKNDNVYLAVTAADGSDLLSASAKYTTFQTKLPKTQAYYVKVVAGGGDTDYDLQIILPFNIVFDPGAVSATVNGSLPGSQTNYYLLRALAGQIMTVSISSPHDDVVLTVYGITDGEPLVRSAMGQTSWTGKLPLTQDYMIEAVSTGGDTRYTLKTVVK